MTFEEMRMRLANRDAIREKQEQEERVEEERELALANQARREQERKRQEELGQQKKQQNASKVAAEADSGSEAEKKLKVIFLKEASKVVVKVLEEYRKDETAKIKTKEDFKYLAKKVRKSYRLSLKSVHSYYIRM